METIAAEPNSIQPLTHELRRIANALEVLAKDATERRERESRGLRAEYTRLQEARDESIRLFDAAESRVTSQFASVRDRDVSRLCEERMNEAWRAVQAFEAAHPELVAREVPHAAV